MYRSPRCTGSCFWPFDFLKILAPIQMVQRLQIALMLVKAGNTSDNFLNEICQIICSLYRLDKITKKVYSNKVNSMQL